jgi:hypothetical protein
MNTDRLHDISIHPECAIEEYANIIFMLVWFNLPKAPVNAEIIKIIIVKKIDVEFNKTRGASFCHENKIATLFHGRFEITWGNQNCKGAIPVFNIKENVINKLLVVKSIKLLISIFEIAGIIKRIEANA